MEQNNQVLNTFEKVSKINLEPELLLWESPILYKEDWINTLGGTKTGKSETFCTGQNPPVCGTKF